MLMAFLPQQLHQLFTVGTVDNVLISVGVDIAFFQSGEVSVQLLVKYSRLPSRSVRPIPKQIMP